MIKLYPWDPAEHLETKEDMKGYLEAALELDDSWIVALVLWDISRAKGVEEIAISAGLDRASVHKSKKRGDVLSFRAVMEAAQALGLRLYAGAAEARRLTQSPNGKPTEDTVSHLNAALDHCDAWGASLALRDIADAMGIRRLVRDAESEKRGEMVDFAAFMDAAGALGLRIYAAAAREYGKVVCARQRGVAATR